MTVLSLLIRHQCQFICHKNLCLYVQAVFQVIDYLFQKKLNK
jgi:hypothetical protein